MTAQDRLQSASGQNTYAEGAILSWYSGHMQKGPFYLDKSQDEKPGPCQVSMEQNEAHFAVQNDFNDEESNALLKPTLFAILNSSN